MRKLPPLLGALGGISYGTVFYLLAIPALFVWAHILHDFGYSLDVGLLKPVVLGLGAIIALGAYIELKNMVAQSPVYLGWY